MADANDYHGHPNYDMIGITLVVLMIVSVFTDFISGIFGILLIFGISTVKAYLVLANFMHLKYEPKLVDLFPYLSIALMIVLFFGVAPDTLIVPNIIAE